MHVAGSVWNGVPPGRHRQLPVGLSRTIVTSQCQVTTRFRHRLFVHQQVNISGTHGVRDDPLLK